MSDWNEAIEREHERERRHFLTDEERQQEDDERAEQEQLDREIERRFYEEDEF